MTDWGYPSNEPCAVCGKHDNNQSESRFGYTACETHKGVPPAMITVAVKQFKWNQRTQWDD